MDVFSDEEIKGLTLGGVNLTCFTYALANATSEDIKSALRTIEEHHPNEAIWVQYFPGEIAV